MHRSAFGRRLRTALAMLVIAVGVLGFTAAGVAARGLGSASFANAHGPLLQVRGVVAVARVLSVLVLVLAAFWAAGRVGTRLAGQAEDTDAPGAATAAGAARWAVARGGLVSVAIDALVGTVLGVVAGVGLGWRFTSLAAGLSGLDRPPPLTAPWPALAGLAAGLGVPLLAAVIVAAGALLARSRHRPAQSAGSLRVGVGRLARYPALTCLTVAVLGLSGAVFLTVAATISDASQILTGFFAQYHADVFVTTPTRPAARVRAVLDRVPGVDRVERLEQVQARTPGGHVIVTATEPGSTLYHYHLLSGRLLSPGEMGAVLVSSSVADASGLRPGGELAITLGGATERLRISGVVLDENTHVGTLGAVFTSLGQLHRLEGVPAGAERGWVIGARSHSPADVGRLAANIGRELAAAGIHAQVQTAQQIMQQNRAQLWRYVLFAIVALLSVLAGLLAVRNAVTVGARRRHAATLRPGGVAAPQVAPVLLTETLCYAGLAWVVAAAIGAAAAGSLMRLISGGELLAWPFEPLAAEQASGRAATPAFLALALALLVITAVAGGGPEIGRARRTAQGRTRPSRRRRVPAVSSSERGGQPGLRG